VANGISTESATDAGFMVVNNTDDALTSVATIHVHSTG